MYFKDMDIDTKTKKALHNRGFVKATEVQEKSIVPALRGDVIVQSKTGSGKTLAFLIPVFETIKGQGNEALILVPTRELAQQVEKEARVIAKYHNVKTVAIYGGVSIDRQVSNLPASIIVGTPGRVMDLMRRGHLDIHNIKVLVLDEADRMLDMGFIEDIRWIISRANINRKTYLFSATMPQEVMRLASRYMKKPSKIILSEDKIAPEKIKQYYVEMEHNEKFEKLTYLLKSEEGKYLIFCNTKSEVQYLSKKLRVRKFPAREIHGDMRQTSRTKVMEEYKTGKIKILVATDVASRGIDVKGITHVINYDVPRFPKDYVHRIGRTGRMNSEGKAITFVTSNDHEFFTRIEEYTGTSIKRVEISKDGIAERRDYRRFADMYGMINVHFTMSKSAGEWEIVREAESVGISEDVIGSIDVNGNKGKMKVHYRFADQIKNIRLFKDVSFGL